MESINSEIIIEMIRDRLSIGSGKNWNFPMEIIYGQRLFDDVICIKYNTFIGNEKPTPGLITLSRIEYNQRLSEDISIKRNIKIDKVLNNNYF